MIPLLVGIGSALLFAIMNIIVTYKLGSLDPLILLFSRGMVAVILLGPFVVRDIPSLFTRAAFSVHLRSVFGAMAVICTFWTLQNTSSLHASFLASLAPMFLMILIFIFYGNTLKSIQLIGLVCVIVGTLLVAGGPSANASNAVWLIGITGAFLSALAMLFLKEATLLFSPQLIVFNFSVLFVIVGSYGLLTFAPSISLVLWLGLMGICSVFGQVLMTLSYKLLDPQIANAFGRSLLIWVGLIEFVMFGSNPGIIDFSGYLISLVGLLVLTVRKPSFFI
ncbi:MAG: hypothetical protein CME62_04015, partial [Halobacteriovoraceae bacterium]|nr:hypothetical protein [Halobacteriovoraceae bacterium]